MARRSGETITRYVAEAPLRSTRADMGLIDPDATAPVFASSSSRTPRHLAKRLDGLEGMLAKLDAVVRQHTEELNEA